MDYRSLVNKLEAIESGATLNEATAPTQFIPTHFHKSNLGTTLPLMQTPDGNFWWEGGQQGGEYNPGASTIVPWNGNTLNRSGWNPASVDGVIKDGKQIEFPEGVNWQQYKEKEEKDKASADLLAKLKQLLELIDKYNTLKAKKSGQGAKPTASTTSAQPGKNPGIDDATREKAKASVAKEVPATGNAAVDNAARQAGNVTVYKEGAISSSLLESFGYDAKTDEGLGSVAAKALGRAAPGVGATLGAMGAVDSWKKGDYLGAALNGLSGAFSLVPGLGWIPAVGLGMWQAGRELSGAADAAGKPSQGAKPTGNVDPKVQALQKKLLAAGADLGPTGADGIMGPKTQAAMQKFPNIKEGTDMNQTKSVAESIKELQNRLAMIESEAQAQAEPATGEENSLGQQLQKAGGQLMEKDGRQFMVLPEKGIAVEIPSMEIVDASTPALTPTGKQFDPAALGLTENLEEGIWDSILKGAAKMATGAKMAGKNLAAGLKGAPGASAPTGAMLGKTGSAATQMQKVMPGSKAAFATGKALNKAGKAIKANPGKAGLAAGLGGLGLGLASGPGSAAGGSANPTGAGTGASGSSGQSNVATAPAGDDEEMKALRAQIDALIAELSKSNDPAILKGVMDAKAKLGS